MKNISSLCTVTLLLVLFSGTKTFAQFDSVPFHLDRKSNEHSLMPHGDIGVGYMKDEFLQFDHTDPSVVYAQENFHFFYKLQAGVYYPMISVGKTGSFGPAITAGVELTRRRINSFNLPVGAMIRFGNNATAVTKKAWGYGVGISVAPTLYFEGAYGIRSVFLNEPMVCVELSTKKITLRADFLPFSMEKKISPTSNIMIDADVSLTLCYSFGKFSSVKIR